MPGPTPRAGAIRDQADYGDALALAAEEEELLGLGFGGGGAYPPSGGGRGKDSRRRQGWKGTVSALSLGLRRHRGKVYPALAFFLLGPLLLWWALATFARSPALLPPSFTGSTLLVVSHPDDECLFFAPALLAAVHGGTNVGAVLVMSSGNHYGLGEVRREELKGSCEELGVARERCDVLDLSTVQDDPKAWWPTASLLTALTTHIGLWSPTQLLTFDHLGISSHINHRAVSAALTAYALSPSALPVWTLETVPIYCKYAGLADLPRSVLEFLPRLLLGLGRPESDNAGGKAVRPLVPPYDATTELAAKESERRRRARGRGERGLLVSGWKGYQAARVAFGRHRTQMVWDRYIYMVISRYMYFNTIERIV